MSLSMSKIATTGLIVLALAGLSACASTKSAPQTGGIGTSPNVAEEAEAAPADMQGRAPVPVARSPGAGAAGASGANAYRAAPGVPTSAYASLVDAGDRILFLTDRHDLTEEARQILARQAEWIRANPDKRVIVAGNCDERGTREYNLALGARRASAARDYLVSLGVPASRIETVSYGKERPVDARPSADGWAVNRNAQTRLLD